MLVCISFDSGSRLQAQSLQTTPTHNPIPMCKTIFMLSMLCMNCTYGVCIVQSRRFLSCSERICPHKWHVQFADLTAVAMSFWGVELKPEKVVPFVPPPEQARLHISQACLASVGKKACNNVAMSNSSIYVVGVESLQYRRTSKLGVEGQGARWT